LGAGRSGLSPNSPCALGSSTVNQTKDRKENKITTNNLTKVRNKRLFWRQQSVNKKPSCFWDSRS